MKSERIVMIRLNVKVMVDESVNAQEVGYDLADAVQTHAEGSLGSGVVHTEVVYDQVTVKDDEGNIVRVYYARKGR